MDHPHGQGADETPTARPRRWITMASVAASAALLLAGCGAPPKGSNTGSTPAGDTTTAGATTAPDEAGPAPDGPAPSGGPTAPGFSLPSLEGKTVRLAEHLGKKVILLDFWHTSCHPCIQAMPELVKLQKKYGDQGFVVLGINADGPDTRADVTAVVRSNKLNFPTLLDEETSVSARYNPKGEFPFTVVIDRRGSIVLKRDSYQAGDEKAMKKLVDTIEQALAQR